MFRRKETQKARERATEYATCKDFQQIFSDEMAGLHLLAYLLTGDADKAEECFVAGLDDSIRGNPVFKQWARAWSKRAIIQNAIKSMRPRVGSAQAGSTKDDTVNGPLKEAAVSGLQSRSSSSNQLVKMVAGWPTFERFVFVMAVLEGYSLRECSSLLLCRDQDVVTAKSQVLQQLATEPAKAAGASALAGTLWNNLFVRAQVA